MLARTFWCHGFPVLEGYSHSSCHPCWNSCGMWPTQWPSVLLYDVMERQGGLSQAYACLCNISLLVERNLQAKLVWLVSGFKWGRKPSWYLALQMSCFWTVLSQLGQGPDVDAGGKWHAGFGQKLALVASNWTRFGHCALGGRGLLWIPEVCPVLSALSPANSALCVRMWSSWLEECPRRDLTGSPTLAISNGQIISLAPSCTL